MRARLFWAVPVSVLLVGCSLAGDVTPPPALATLQAAQEMATSPSDQQAGAPERIAGGAGPVPTPNRGPNLADGEAIFGEKCAPCHGPVGMGGGELAAGLEVPPPAIGNPQIGEQATLSEWYVVVTEGRMERFMPPFSSLSDEQRWDVTAYALSLSASPEQLAQGAALYAEECASCHGPDGNQGGEVDLSDPAFMARHSAADLYAAITDGAAGMPSFAQGLGEAERWAVARYVQTLAFSQGVAQGGTAIPSEETPEAAFGTIEGQVINGTAGAAPPSGLEVELHGFDGDTEALKETAAVGENGSFAFQDLEVVPGRLYVAALEYEGILYASEIAHLAMAGETLNLPITIFETTQGTEAVSVDRLHLLFDFSHAGVVRVLELWVISNLGDKTIATPEGEGLLEISLPEGAGQPNFEDSALGERYLATETGFIDRMPLRPGAGMAQLIFDFEMPYRRRLDFSQAMNYPLQAAVVLVDEGGPKVRGEGVEDRGLMTVSDLQMQTYALGPLAAGEDVQFSVSGSAHPLIELGGENASRNLAIALGTLGIALIGVGGWWYFTKREGQGVVTEQVGGGSADAGESPREGGASRQELLQAMADLDDSYAAGELSEPEYRRRRQELKERALEQMKEGGG
jgi:mono/diheme cytochrome c family protein